MSHDKAPQSTEPRYVPCTVVMKWREIDTPIMRRGKEESCYQAPVVTQYVDTHTGEILETKAIRKDKELLPELHFSERCLQREFILNSLRPEVREFALFVLTFRNRRRGVTPGFGQLVKWYAELTGKRADNVRRFINPLEEAGIVAGESLLGPLFQIAGKSVAAWEHLCEDSNAYSRLVLIRLRQRAMDSGPETDGEPGWLSFVAQVETADSAVLHHALPAHIKELISRYVLEHPEGQFA